MIPNIQKSSQFSCFRDLKIELSALKITNEKFKSFILFTSTLQKPLRFLIVLQSMA